MLWESLANPVDICLGIYQLPRKELSGLALRAEIMATDVNGDELCRLCITVGGNALIATGCGPTCASLDENIAVFSLLVLTKAALQHLPKQSHTISQLLTE